MAKWATSSLNWQNGRLNRRENICLIVLTFLPHKLVKLFVGSGVIFALKHVPIFPTHTRYMHVRTTRQQFFFKRFCRKIGFGLIFWANLPNKLAKLPNKLAQMRCSLPGKNLFHAGGMGKNDSLVWRAFIMVS